MSLNLKALLKKPQRSQFRTPFKTPSQSSPLNNSTTSSSFKIPSLTLSNGSTSSRKRSSKSLSPDSLVLPPLKVQHLDAEVHIEEEKEDVKDGGGGGGGVGKERQDSVCFPRPPSAELTPVSKVRESPGGSGDTTHVSDTPSWGPSPSQSISVIETPQLEENKVEEVVVEEEVLPYTYEGGANFDMDLSDLDKEYPINSQPEPEPEAPYGVLEDKDFLDDCESEYLSPSQQELVTPTVPVPPQVSLPLITIIIKLIILDNCPG